MISPYTIYLECNLMHYLFDKILLLQKAGVTNLPPLKESRP
jgi:hypothetical protein